MTRYRPTTALAVLSGLSLVLAGCGAGSRTGEQNATAVACGFTAPEQPVTVDVLAYNSSAIDPFTNTMVKSCTKDGVTVTHEPVDFAGQVQKTTATLAGDSGTYDVVETYGFILPQLASQEKLQPLDDLVAQHSEEYGLDQLNDAMVQAMTYEGELYGLPMQAQTYVMAYRKDVFDELGLTPPKTFAELREVSAKIQAAGQIEHPLALPLLASGDIATAYDAALGSLGVDYVDPATKTANFGTPEAARAFEELRSLLPFMDPEVTTFDQPTVQQQMYNGTAAIAMMFSGRMNDLTLATNSQYAEQFAFAAPPTVGDDGPFYGALSVDGWSLPANTDVDPSLLFEIVASSVSEEASKASVPAAYPARDGIVTDDSSAYAAAARESLDNMPPAEPFPWTSEISTATTEIVANVVTGRTSVADGTAQMQAKAEEILAGYR
ncbi:extracellular solute-binding protein [Kineococcus sp. NUM-3379]